MRIISGKFKGRRFDPPIGKWPTRPTMDFTREALFNVLNNRIDLVDISVLDIFGGTGSVSFEFISRGASNVTYVDSFYKATVFVKQFATELDVSHQMIVYKSDVLSFLKKTKENYDLIFCDPPYKYKYYNEVLQLIYDRKLLNADGLLILEHDAGNNFENHAQFIEARSYGESKFSFLSGTRTIS